ncbi:MAG: ABC-type transport auxiliary lipoprotein family protein [Alkalimonas sp.]|nr:ABC-type transport auxiliary lipoprotein family protein [Alkalimonas sp.]
MKLLLLFALVLPALLACASTPVKTQYYQLPYVDAGSIKHGVVKERQLVVLQSLQLAPYLNQQGIAFQQSPTELSLAKQHLWADDLTSQLQRHLRQSIASQSAGWALLPTGAKASVQLSIQLDRFVGTAEGYALLSGEYQLKKNDRVVTQRFLLEQPLLQDGYPALVEALAEGWQQLAANIVQQLEQFE